MDCNRVLETLTHTHGVCFFGQADVLWWLTLPAGESCKGCNSPHGPPNRGGVVSRPLCASGNQAEFRGEMILHFRGLKNLDKSGVLLFPNLQVCLDCGFSRFRTTETELALLAGGTSTSERLTMVAS